MTADSPVVFVVDDDDAMREALDDLFRSVNLRVQSYATAPLFLEAWREDIAGCLVLDVRLPGASGLEFQRQLLDSGIDIPIIFITGHGDIPMSVQAMKAGAVEFLTKPFRDQDLLDAVQLAIAKDVAQRRNRLNYSGLRKRYETLTPREKEVMTLLVSGRLNKQIGATLGATESTVKAHRTHIMQKMRAGSIAELVRMADRLDLAVP
jgi:FixJ family two-component response regulator